MNPDQPSLEGAAQINAAAQAMIAPVAAQLMNAAITPVEIGNSIVASIGGALKRKATSLANNAARKLSPVQGALGMTVSPSPALAVPVPPAGAPSPMQPTAPPAIPPTIGGARCFICCCNNPLGRPFVYITPPEYPDVTVRQKIAKCPCLRELPAPLSVIRDEQQWVFYLATPQGQAELRAYGCPSTPLEVG